MKCQHALGRFKTFATKSLDTKLIPTHNVELSQPTSFVILLPVCEEKWRWFKEEMIQIYCSQQIASTFSGCFVDKSLGGGSRSSG